MRNFIKIKTKLDFNKKENNYDIYFVEDVEAAKINEVHVKKIEKVENNKNTENK